MADLLITLVNISFWVALHFGMAFAVSSLPAPVQRRLFDCGRPFFAVSDRELRFYRRIGLPAWKDRLPQYNVDFDKKHLAKPLDRQYLEDFLHITCKSEIIHYAVGVCGYLSVLFCLFSQDRGFWSLIYCLIATAVLLCNLPFAWIQRYNRRRLLRIWDRMSARQKGK